MGLNSKESNSKIATPIAIAHTCQDQANLPCPACVRADLNRGDELSQPPAPSPAVPTADYTGYIAAHLDNARTELALAKERAGLLNYPSDFQHNLITGIRIINLVLERHHEFKAGHAAANRKTG